MCNVIRVTFNIIMNKYFYAELFKLGFESKGGRLTVAVPAEEHLWEMKEVLYDTPYPNPENDGNLPGFRLVKKESVKTEVSLPTQESIASLFAMTPYFYRTPRAGRERLLALSSLKVQASFHILTYEKVSM